MTADIDSMMEESFFDIDKKKTISFSALVSRN